MIAAAVFRLQRANVKSTDPNDPTRLVQTGGQQTGGVVLSAAGNLTRRWKVHAGYASLDARIIRDTTAAPAGRRVGLVPRRQGSLWMTYEFASRVGVGGGVIAQSRVFTSFTNQVQLPSYARVDGLLYYRLGRYRVALNAENLLDAKYYPTANGDNNISPGAPRTARISLSASF